ncbi:hypothetical protein ONS96_014763 [Cadophora gregata f. sp. sojae]|nr:hypothetical protein ONS96_014763 [Cadophora gregata f. sp. sojae]
MTDVDTLLECCSSLLKTSQTVQGALELAHFSVKQYLLAIDSRSPPQIAKYQVNEDESTLTLAQVCLTYLNFQCFRHGPEQSVKDYNSMLIRRPFLPHASKYWDYYAQGHMKHPSMMASATSLFSSSNMGNFRHWNQALILSLNGELGMESDIYTACMEAPPLHWAALLALHEILRDLLEVFSPNCHSGMGVPLYCALIGPELLLHGVSKATVQDIEQKSWRPASRLLAVQTLLSAGADPNSDAELSTGHDNSHVAFHATDSQADFLTVLLKAGAKITADTLACAFRLKDDTEAIHGIISLARGGGNSLKDESDRDAFNKIKLHLPSFQDGVVQPSEQSFQSMMARMNRTEISKALENDVRHGLSSRVQARLEAIRNSSLKGQFLIQIQEHFCYAISHENREMVEIFLNNGAKVDRQSFFLAVQTRASKIVDRFLKESPGIVDHDDLVATIIAGDYETFSSLKSTGIDMSCRSLDGCLLIQYALQNDDKLGSPGRISIIEALLKLNPPLQEPCLHGDLPIHCAAMAGMSEVVDDFIRRGSPVDTEGASGYRPTHHASKKDSIKTMQMLLDAGADRNAKRGGVGGGPLHYAAIHNATECTRLLIQAGAELEQLSSSQYTPLLIASIRHSWNAAQVLIHAGGNVNVYEPGTQCTPLILASQSGCLEVVELIVKRETDLDFKNLEGENALYLAAKHDHIEIVDILLKSNAKPDADRKGYDGTPLHWAIVRHFVDVARLLLDYNAELETLNCVFQTPLLVATSVQEWEIAKLLVSKGANVNVKDSIIGVTPLHNASLYGHTELVELLLEKGAEVNATTTEGRTPLLEAALNGNLPTLKLLVGKGADIHAQDHTEASRSALSEAISHTPSVEVVNYLLGLGADGDLQSNGADSCLELAIKSGNTPIVQTLLAHGVDVNAQRTLSKHTPIMRAVRHNQAEICRILLEHGADLTLRDYSDRTVAHQIMKYANAEILKLFLPFNVDWTHSEKTHSIDFEDGNVSYGFSPLHLAAKYNFPDAINILFDEKLVDDVNCICGGNLTPLHFAANAGSLAAMEALLTKGADIHAVTAKERQNALHIAARLDNLKCVSALLERGAEPGHSDKHGRTAAELCSSQMVRLVIQQALKERGSTSRLVTSEITGKIPGIAIDPRSQKLIKACEDGNLTI